MNRGFTLIEISIVLVIIGLITGGILVGQDLIAAATVRAQITQMEKYNAAVNTFRGKYGYLPGDIPDPTATQYGFNPRGPFPGEGDGNGVIQGLDNSNATANFDNQVGSGESVAFWVDLSTSRLIPDGLNIGAPTLVGSAYTATLPLVGLYLPAAKIGAGNYVYVWSGGYTPMSGMHQGDGRNYFGLSAVNTLFDGEANATATIRVVQAYNIDIKIDDGLPQLGRVQAAYFDNTGGDPELQWAGTGGAHCIAGGTTWSKSATSCFDNNGSPGVVTNYSISQNNGTGLNCALSFRFQ